MSFGIWELVIILAIVALLFGTRKLGSIGSDIGNAIKGFRSAMREDETPGIDEKPGSDAPSGKVIDAEVESGNDKPS